MYDTLLLCCAFFLTSASRSSPAKAYCVAVNGWFLLYAQVACQMYSSWLGSALLDNCVPILLS